jgi:hypothetical protein
MEQSLRGLAEAVPSRDQLPSLRLVWWDETQRLSEDSGVQITSIVSAAGVDFSLHRLATEQVDIGESQSIAHPSDSSNVFRLDPHSAVSPAHLPPVVQPALDKRSPDL